MRIAPALLALSLSAVLTPASADHHEYDAATPPGKPAATAPVSHPTTADDADTAGARLVVKVTGLDPDEGGFYLVAIHDDAARWPGIDQALEVKKIPVDEQEQLSVEFSDLEMGQVYAVQVLHDENDNAELDMKWLVMPAEGFGLSNDYKPREKPKFDKAAVTLEESPMQIAIEVEY